MKKWKTQKRIKENKIQIAHNPTVLVRVLGCCKQQKPTLVYLHRKCNWKDWMCWKDYRGYDKNQRRENQEGFHQNKSQAHANVQDGTTEISKTTATATITTVSAVISTTSTVLPLSSAPPLYCDDLLLECSSVIPWLEWGEISQASRAQNWSRHLLSGLYKCRWALAWPWERVPPYILHPGTLDASPQSRSCVTHPGFDVPGGILGV